MAWASSLWSDSTAFYNSVLHLILLSTLTLICPSFGGLMRSWKMNKVMFVYVLKLNKLFCWHKDEQAIVNQKEMPNRESTFDHDWVKEFGFRKFRKWNRSPSHPYPSFPLSLSLWRGNRQLEKRCNWTSSCHRHNYKTATSPLLSCFSSTTSTEDDKI